MSARSPGASPRRCTARAPSSPSPIRARRSASGCGRLAQSIGSDFVVECDVADEPSLDAVFAALAERWGRLDFVVHAIAFSDKDELKGKYVHTSAGQFSAHPRNLLLFVHRHLPARGAADDRGRQPVDLDLFRRRAGHAALQRHGSGQGRARGERALSRGRSRRRQYPRQRDLGRADQDARRLGDRRFPLHPEMEPAELAAEAQCHDRGCRRRRRFIC